MTDTIAHLDLRQFRDGDAADRQAFTQALMSALKRHGFITLEGHLVDDALLEASYRTAEAFFAQDDAEKRRFAGALRGYTPFGVEHAKDHAAPDLKEFWQIGHETGGEHPNVWPDNPRRSGTLSSPCLSACLRPAICSLEVDRAGARPAAGLFHAAHRRRHFAAAPLALSAHSRWRGS
jgi:isopenicillin N synthase-like dioxygenase